MSKEFIISNNTLIFNQVEITFENKIDENIFAHKNNKTLEETIHHKKYQGLFEEISTNYQPCLDLPLGQFLLERKNEGDLIYTKFLNKYGDVSYSRFLIADPIYNRKKGIYAYYENEALRYIGRCRDSIKKRINQGYGKIHPKNCYKDGQATNCRINALITQSYDTISFWFCELECEEEIISYEKNLIHSLTPPWNIQK